MAIQPKQFGVLFNPPTICLVYTLEGKLSMLPPGHSFETVQILQHSAACRLQESVQCPFGEYTRTRTRVISPISWRLRIQACSVRKLLPRSSSWYATTATPPYAMPRHATPHTHTYSTLSLTHTPTPARTAPHFASFSSTQLRRTPPTLHFSDWHQSSLNKSS